MTTINLKDVEKFAKQFTTIEQVKKEIRSIQSQKCRLMKQKSKENYDQDFAKIVLKEQMLKEVRSYFEPKKITTTTMSQADIDLLTFDETVKAIKSIQSKKCNTQYLTNDIETNEEYQNALKIEKMLLDHKKLVKPVEDTVVQKSKINDLMNELQNLDSKISKEYILEQLQNLL